VADHVGRDETRRIDESERDEGLRVERARREADDQREADLRARYPGEPLAVAWGIVPTLESIAESIRNVTLPRRSTMTDRHVGAKPDA
jgi:hypothetical protein